MKNSPDLNARIVYVFFLVFVLLMLVVLVHAIRGTNVSGQEADKARIVIETDCVTAEVTDLIGGANYYPIADTASAEIDPVQYGACIVHASARFGYRAPYRVFLPFASNTGGEP